MPASRWFERSGESGTVSPAGGHSAAEAVNDNAMLTFWRGNFLVRRVNYYTMGKGGEAAVGASRKIQLIGGDDKVEKYTWDEVKKHVS